MRESRKNKKVTLLKIKCNGESYSVSGDVNMTYVLKCLQNETPTNARYIQHSTNNCECLRHPDHGVVVPVNATAVEKNSIFCPTKITHVNE